MIQLPDIAFAFIDDEKPDHVCNSDDGVILLDSGERVANTPENQAKYYDLIRGGSVICTFCGQAAIDRAMWDFWD